LVLHLLPLLGDFRVELREFRLVSGIQLSQFLYFVSKGQVPSLNPSSLKGMWVLNFLLEPRVRLSCVPLSQELTLN
jgi:hypothetical protein